MRKLKQFIPLTVCILLAQVSMAQLSGTYRIGSTPIPGETGSYASFGAAVTALNAGGVNGPCTFYFSDNGTYAETSDVAIGYTGGSSTNTVTFKPYTGVVCSITFSNTGTRTIDGSLVIGAADASAAVPGSLISTNYLVFDGSNTTNGTSRDLTISNTNITAQKSLIRIFGNNDNFTIKNCILISSCTSASTNAAINITNYFSSPTNYNPDNLTIQNNSITSTSGTASAGIHSANSGAATVGANNLTVRDNTIAGNLRGIFVSYTNGGDIYNNTVSVTSTGTTTNVTAYGITVQTNFTAGTFNIYSNDITNLTTNTTSAAGASNGIIGIDNQCVAPKIVNIYNNVIRGFAVAGLANNAKIYGIRHTSSSTSSIYNNSIYMPEMTNMSTPNGIAAIAFASAAATEASPAGTCIVKNNTAFIDESSMKVWAIRRVGTTGTFTSDNNNLFVNVSNSSGNIGFFNASDASSLPAWQSASSQDASSITTNPNFTSTTNLTPTLAGYFPGTNTLYPATDISGTARSTTKPHIGAYESTAKHWLGTTNDWSTASNWRDNSTPTSGDNVIIGYNTTNTSLPSSTSVNNIGLQAGTALGVGANTLTIAGSIAGIGTLTTTSSSNLTLGGTAGSLNFTSNPTQLKNLSLNSGATATLINAVEIASGATPGTVTVGTGAILTAGPNLKLKSDGSGTASIGVVDGTLTGTVTCEKYIAGGGLSTDMPSKRAYRFLAHPFNGAIALSQLQTSIDITGSGTGFDASTSNNPSAFYWNPAAANGAVNDAGWSAATNTTTSTWGQYQAARVFYRGTKGTGLSGAAYTVGSATLSLSGIVNTGNQTINLSYPNTGTTSNFNFVGNPYASNVQMSGVTRTNATSSYYVWNLGLGNRGGYSTVSFGTSYVLPAFAGFFVESNAGAGNIVFHETDKTTNAATHTLLRNSSKNQLLLQLKSDNILWDELLIENNQQATAAKEYADATKLMNPDVSLFALSSNNESLAIDKRNIHAGSIVPLGLATATARAFTIEVKEMAITDVQLYLHDKYLGTEQLLEAGMVYSFTTDANPASQGNARFELVAKKPTVIAPIINEFMVRLSPNPAKDIVKVSFSNESVANTSITIINALGKTVKKISAGTVQSGQINIPVNNLSKGIYYVTLDNGMEKKTEKLIIE